MGEGDHGGGLAILEDAKAGALTCKTGIRICIYLLFFPSQGAQTTLYCCLEDKISGDSGRYYSDCREKRPSARARSEADQARLWEVSERMVGLKPDGEGEGNNEKENGK